MAMHKLTGGMEAYDPWPSPPLPGQLGRNNTPPWGSHRESALRAVVQVAKSFASAHSPDPSQLGPGSTITEIIAPVVFTIAGCGACRAFYNPPCPSTRVIRRVSPFKLEIFQPREAVDYPHEIIIEGA
ncbi:hypothetical protein C8R45DRAFT_1098380 [Mycena sanguinolenta]|nr:hypothetical protein C8R45DRAFT_1098380 [Mycena sanguinolenta]